jgi:hypothetical protein
MTRIRWAGWLCVLAIAPACRTAHLGATHGERYLAAFEAQANSEAKPPPAPADAQDAARALLNHRVTTGGEEKQAAEIPSLEN